MNLMDRIRSLMNEGETMTAFAERVDIPFSTLRSWLGYPGITPTVQSLMHLSDVTGVSIAWLLTGLGPLRRDDLRQLMAEQPLRTVNQERGDTNGRVA